MSAIFDDVTIIPDSTYWNRPGSGYVFRKFVSLTVYDTILILETKGHVYLYEHGHNNHLIIHILKLLLFKVYKRHSNI